MRRWLIEFQVVESSKSAACLRPSTSLLLLRIFALISGVSRSIDPPASIHRPHRWKDHRKVVNPALPSHLLNDLTKVQILCNDGQEGELRTVVPRLARSGSAPTNPTKETKFK